MLYFRCHMRILTLLGRGPCPAMNYDRETIKLSIRILGFMFGFHQMYLNFIFHVSISWTYWVHGVWRFNYLKRPYFLGSKSQKSGVSKKSMWKYWCFSRVSALLAFELQKSTYPEKYADKTIVISLTQFPLPCNWICYQHRDTNIRRINHIVIKRPCYIRNLLYQ